MFWVLKRTVSLRQFFCLIETVLLSTHNICFGLEIRKLIFWKAPLTTVLCELEIFSQSGSVIIMDLLCGEIIVDSVQLASPEAS